LPFEFLAGKFHYNKNKGVPMFKKSLLLCFAIIFLAGCAFLQSFLTPPTPTRDLPPEVQTDIASAQLPTETYLPNPPTLVEHPAPTLRLDMSPFEDAGCPLDESGYRRCTEDGALYALGCGLLDQPNDVVAALTPSIPVALCESREYSSTTPQPAHLYNWGCSRPSYMSLVVKEEGGYRLVSTLEDLQTLFAPIETSEEALAYAVAATGYEPRYDLEKYLDPSFRFFIAALEETHVTEVSNGGYSVNLFRYQWCGCGPHAQYQIMINVSQNGAVSVGEPQKLWEDPAQDGLCVD
jgi:hypothetical protein